MLAASLEKYYHLERITDSSRWLALRYLSIALRYPTLLWKRYDLCVAGFVGHPLVPMLRLFTRKPILFDAFISIYDTLVYDRRRISPHSPLARLAFAMDKTSCSLADFVLVDTHAHAQYFHNTFGIPLEKIKVLLVGCDETLFFPRPTPPDPNLVLYYSSFLPLHGTEIVVRAAHLLQEQKPNLRFHIIGSGIESKHIQNLVEQLGVKNVLFSRPVPLKQLPDHIAEAALCLGGHFGSSEKAGRVIAGKTFQCLGMGKPTIVGENAANHELLTHAKDAWFCSMNDPLALAEAIHFLIDRPEISSQLGYEAHSTFLNRASYQVLGEELHAIIERVLANRP
jgi:glycosyltransferase involved in cell wall biosynthesis